MLVFIVNPSSGSGKGHSIWLQVEASLKRRQAAYRCEFTAGSGDAEHIARRLAEEGDFDTLVTVGGDGTLNEAVNGLLQGGFTGKIGVIPAGSGNDFARGHGIPMQPLEALRTILHHPLAKPIDVMKAGERWAVSSAGAGLDGQVAYTANRSAYKKWMNKLRLGKLAYVLSLLQVLFTFRPATVRLQDSEGTVTYRQVWLLAFANIPYIGGGMRIAPHAVPDDGSLEVCVVSGIGRLELLRVFPKVYTGRHVGHPAVKFRAGRRFRLESDRNFFLHTDGEYAGHSPVTVEIHPRKLSIITPGEGRTVQEESESDGQEDRGSRI